MNFSDMNDGSGLTSEEKLQNEIAGDDTQLIFTMFGTDE